MRWINLHTKKVAGLRISAILEVFIFLAVMLIASYIIDDGNRFFAVSPSPYWIIVIFVAAQYGINEAIFTAIACTCFLLIGNMPEQTLDQTTYGYYLYIVKTPLLWFIISVVLGLLRTKHILQHQNLKKKYQDADHYQKTITQGYNRLKSIKELLERRLASQLTTTSKSYSVISDIEVLSHDKFLEKVPETISETLNPKVFSIYLMHDNGLVLYHSTGWQDDDVFKTVFSKESALYECIVSGAREYLSIVYEQDREVLGDQGVLACRLQNKSTGAVFGMIKIERLEFTDLNASVMATFAALCDWVSTGYTKSVMYEEAEENRFLVPTTKIYTYVYYKHQEAFLLKLASTYHFPLYRLTIHLDFEGRPKDLYPALSLREAIDAVTPLDVVLYYSDVRDKFYSLIRSIEGATVDGYIKDIEQTFLSYTSNRVGIQIESSKLSHRM